MPDAFWVGLFAVIGSLVGSTLGFAAAYSRLRFRRGEAEFDRREFRRGVYLQFLKSFDALINPAESGSATLDQTHLQWQTFLDAHNEVELAASLAINQIAYRLHDFVEQLYAEMVAVLERPGTSVELTTVVTESVSELRVMRRELVGAMRDDVQTR